MDDGGAGGKPHPDEERAVETRAQTEHKLQIMRRYYGKYLGILTRPASAARDRVFLVDLFAGAGLHLSADHADGAIDGTPLLACTYARASQRRAEGARVRVRLVDLEADYCARLDERTAPFRNDSVSPVDVAIYHGDYADAIAPIADEIAAIEGARSLWLIDPYGPKALRYKTLQPLLLQTGVEIIINLDVTGIQRMRGVAMSENATYDEAVANLADKNAARLTDLYNGTAWRDPDQHCRRRPGMTVEHQLAELYKNVFTTFKCRNVYPLRASDHQYRFLIHLAKSPTAEIAFAKVYESTMRVGLYEGRALDDAVASQHATSLYTAYRGNTVALDEMYGAQVVTLDRGQLRRVLEYADAHEYGRFVDGTMTWVDDRKVRAIKAPVKPPDRQTSLFDF